MHTTGSMPAIPHHAPASPTARAEADQNLVALGIVIATVTTFAIALFAGGWVRDLADPRVHGWFADDFVQLLATASWGLLFVMALIGDHFARTEARPHLRWTWPAVALLAIVAFNGYLAFGYSAG